LLHYTRVKLKPKEEDRLLAGHPWVFANEVETGHKPLTPGSLVEVITSKGHPVGRGVASPSSKILIRLLTSGFEQEIDEAFIVERVKAALKAREGYSKKFSTDGLRLLFGEGDGLPGIIADGFGETAVLSCFSAGLKPFMQVISKTLQENGYPFVYEKSVGEICQKEGMPEFQGWLTKEGPMPVTFKEGKAKFNANPVSGQKTGFYLDFREARRQFGELSRGKKVLDLFCYTGAASVQSALGGAAEVLALDSSQNALDEAAEHARLNGVEKIVRFEKRDSFKAVRDLKKEEQTFDVILLDPPPLAKSVHELPAGRTAMKRLIGNALDMLNPGGDLIIASCSHHFSWTVLEGISRDAVEESTRNFQLTGRLTQPPDHPIILCIPETEYLRILTIKEANF
jgi:23S rRNA (cytosine1962-C5)-methyltransferase